MRKKGKVIKCCPNCGGRIKISYLYQYSYDHFLGKHGKILKKCKKRDVGSMEIALANCTNESCDTSWEDGDFIVDENGCFLDLKYSGEWE